MFRAIKEGLDWARHDRSQRRQWRSARTLGELGQRGAAWARGDLGAHPSGYGVPAAETESLLPVLARANEAGFFTYQSQPGGTYVEDGQAVDSRAFVEGFLERDLLEPFRAVMGGRGLLVLDSLTHDEPLLRHSERGEAGGRWRARADGSLSHLSSRACAALADAADLTVIDLVWGRGPVLWACLDRWAAGRGAS